MPNIPAANATSEKVTVMMPMTARRHECVDSCIAEEHDHSQLLREYPSLS
jgi:hypothetical protein